MLDRMKKDLIAL
jgi:hypothetical protein